MAFFLAVERYANWLVDKENQFKFYGLPEKHVKKADEIREGDVLLIYVSSGRSAFAGARRVRSSKLRKLSFGGDYDVACPYAIDTEAISDLEEAAWVPVKSIASELAFTQAGDWRQKFRTSIKRLSDGDGERILAALTSREQGVAPR